MCHVGTKKDGSRQKGYRYIRSSVLQLFTTAASTLLTLNKTPQTSPDQQSLSNMAVDSRSSFKAMDEYQRQLAAHFAAGGTLEEAARKRRTWDAPAVKESLSMWQLGASVAEIEAEMKRRNYSIVEGTTVKQSLIEQGQKI